MKHLRIKLVMFIASFLFFIPFFLQGSTPKYYYFIFYYNTIDNSLKLNANSNLKPIGLTDMNLTYDIGQGSQFYAKVFGFDGKAKNFKEGSDRFYLGKWTFLIFKDGQRFSEVEVENEGEVRVSVPYFPDGSYVNIYDAKNDQLKLSIDVSSFSQRFQVINEDNDGKKQNESNEDNLENKNKNPQAKEGKIKEKKLGWSAIGKIFVFLIVLFFGFWGWNYWKRRKSY